MGIERTFSMIKPDAVKRNLIGSIIKELEDNGLRMVAAKFCLMNKKQAEDFYIIHKDRSFFSELVQAMTSGPVFLQVLEGENAVSKNREIMGDTDPKKAFKGSIRNQYGLSIGENSIHGSDSLQTAVEEISYWFAKNEILG
ncbi:Nucleoside diphosphate kinase [Candidatus Liberibacter solanacearum]|uniref:Nucleoside diphosphate kinase n=1 Tax=Candidatus Liberibacter solanacearum TaxID=556287 RepID=A0A095BGC7_9HYPH|nr:nucleoside-diphosphate kinase [Candidatus Liberibacter solanacearum]KGB27848.1 phosphodiesterase [Candidatus Liberibacter solanacearum]KJZ81121.1 phosphodiesterase [Candidatus Liberibacter solanacearum]KJZ82325.1 Nucleoside diphosphate kinase [Candidatus Liberibacter solanacearum]KQC49274.1 phosphodiesterase [Candidatus Liberibacter solanacearum]RPD37478.1 nucleoside-diphosphate kinase [Candidatus Liberibacter solanacearum]